MFIRLRTARPDGWTPRLIDLAVIAVALPVVIIVLLARLPELWVEVMFGRPVLVRVVLAILAVMGFMLLDNSLRLLLSKTPYLFGRTLTVRSRGHRVRLPVREICAIHVETRPPDGRETFVVEMRSGDHHDLCPVEWPGAGRIYRGLARSLPR